MAVIGVSSASPAAPPAPTSPLAGSAPPPATRTVLIGFADALAAPETAWSLIDAGARVTAFARRGTRPALRHARGVRMLEVTPPEQDVEATIRELATALELGFAETLMPLDDAAVWLADAIARRHREARVVGPTGPSAALALDKRVQLLFARNAGFAVPATQTVKTAAELRALSLPLPIALKPALAARVAGGRLRRGRGWVCGSAVELQAAGRAWGEAEPLLAQPLIAGTGEGLFGLAEPGGLRALSAHRRVRMANPQGSGSSACRSIPVDPTLAAAAERMLTAAGWRGLFMLEFLRDAEGTPWFMELNGRPWGSMALARRQGLEYPAWALSPEGAPAGAVGRDGLVCRHLGRELIHLLMVARGPSSVALTAWPSRRRALSEVLRVGRDEGWYNARPGERRVLVADTVQTVLAPFARGRRRR